jgi:excisionase family DNA binding protein
LENKKLTMTIEEAAQSLGISRNLGYRLAATGELPGVLHLGQKRMVVSKAVLDRYIQGVHLDDAKSIS